MWFINWIKGLFSNPKTTAAGVGALAGAAALSYGMSTGTVPITTETVATAGGLASAGVAGLVGKDAVGQKITEEVTQIVNEAKAVSQVVENVKEVAKAAGK